MEPQTITPYLIVSQLDDVVRFAEEVLGAEELMRAAGSAGGTHCEIRIGDSKVMLGAGANGAPKPSMLHVYVRDVDAAYQRALAAGGKELSPPRDQEYGDRDCTVEDAGGNQWCFATARGGAHKPEALRDVTLYLHPQNVAELVPFYERAFGAETLERYEAPSGEVVHAKLRIGNSVFEMGEAHGQWAPMPTMIYESVGDADAAYARAIEAGATPVMAPAKQPYGERVGAIDDPAGNRWYLAQR